MVEGVDACGAFVATVVAAEWTADLVHYAAYVGVEASLEHALVSAAAAGAAMYFAPVAGAAAAVEQKTGAPVVLVAAAVKHQAAAVL